MRLHEQSALGKQIKVISKTQDKSFVLLECWHVDDLCNQIFGVELTILIWHVALQSTTKDENQFSSKVDFFFFTQSRDIYIIFLSNIDFPRGIKMTEHEKCVCRLSADDFFISDDTGRFWNDQSFVLFFSSHCGGGTGAEGWSVSTGRGVLDSVGVKQKLLFSLLTNSNTLWLLVTRDFYKICPDNGLLTWLQVLNV